MKPAIMVFSRSAPCTMRHLWNCFRSDLGWLKVQVDIAHSQVGVNSVRGMEQKQRLIREIGRAGDYYALTPLGMAWLENGIRSHIRNHPGDAKNVKFAPMKTQVEMHSTSVKRITRTRG